MGRVKMKVEPLSRPRLSTLAGIMMAYHFVYEDEFQAPTTVEGFKSQPRAPGVFTVFDSVPGQPNYSPIWHNNWLLVPRDYKVDSIRSVDAVKGSGYRIVDSPIYVN
ncbi:MAG: hypothetical protein M1358_17600 [Chloroflexi bacterium]|nr:hypothetical protein [Chloroflexota bacterium]